MPNKYHLNPQGNPGICRASVSHCPFGTEAQHYSSVAKAQQAYEQSMLHENIVKFRKDSPKNSSDFVNEFNSYFYGGDASESEKEEVEGILIKSMTGINKFHPFEAATELQKAFAKNSKEVFTTEEDQEILQSVPPHVYLKAILPAYGKVIAAFEEQFIYAGVTARGDVNSDNYKPYELEETFFRAVNKPGTLESDEALYESFREEALKDGWTNLDKISNLMSDAAEDARNAINLDRQGFFKDVKSLEISLVKYPGMNPRATSAKFSYDGLD